MRFLSARSTVAFLPSVAVLLATSSQYRFRYFAATMSLMKLHEVLHIHLFALAFLTAVAAGGAVSVD
jgi:hypothetical protein